MTDSWRSDDSVPSWDVPPSREACDHCWHTDPEQPRRAQPLVVDQTCCFCGARRSLQMVWQGPRRHGPFAPGGQSR